jgi:hypothetical protein
MSLPNIKSWSQRQSKEPISAENSAEQLLGSKIPGKYSARPSLDSTLTGELERGVSNN